MTVQVVNDHDAGRKPGVRGTEIQEKMCTIEPAGRRRFTPRGDLRRQQGDEAVGAGDSRLVDLGLISEEGRGKLR
jgi:hypothetical protein